jgi:hypothetical protein
MLLDLQSDLEAIYILTTNMNWLFNQPDFMDVVHGVQNEIDVELLSNLERFLSGCSEEAQKLLRILDKLGLQVQETRLKQVKLQRCLNRRKDGID